MISDFLVWFKFIFIVVTFGAALFFYKNRRTDPQNNKSKFIFLIAAALGFWFFYPFLETVSQYFVWRTDPLSQFILPPHNPISYFFSYAWLHFWLSAVLTIGLSAVFYLLLTVLKRYNERFFEEGETELGFLCALLTGWPQFVVFVALVFILTAVFSVFRGLFLKKSYTTLGTPFLAGTAVSLIGGHWLILIFGLGVLRI